MNHTLRQAGESAQGGRIVQVTQQRRDAGGSQRGQARRTGSQCQQAHTRRQAARQAHADITAADNQQAQSTKARRQGAG